jgi:hypothetical protein
VLKIHILSWFWSHFDSYWQSNPLRMSQTTHTISSTGLCLLAFGVTTYLRMSQYALSTSSDCHLWAFCLLLLARNYLNDRPMPLRYFIRSYFDNNIFSGNYCTIKENPTLKIILSVLWTHHDYGFASVDDKWHMPHAFVSPCMSREVYGTPLWHELILQCFDMG